MQTVHDGAALRSTVGAWRRDGETIGFVPTMGALHEGHLSLVRRARDLADRVVASIFVNPTQFNQAEDLAKYPRTPEQDAAALAEAGCDLLYMPTEEDVYPGGSAANATWVVPGGAAEGLEGAFRPGHFRGVATVVLKLFNLVRPDLAVFGEKDAQQLAVIRQMVRDLLVPVKIIPGPTMREPDGLAMSSRNVRLSAEERQDALVLHRALEAAAQVVRSEGPGGSADAVRAAMNAVLEPAVAERVARIDYAEVVDATTFQPIDRLPDPRKDPSQEPHLDQAGEIVLPLAVWIGETRLIDNLRLKIN